MSSWWLGPGSTSETPDPHGSKRLKVDARKLNDSLYELWKPSGTPKMELLFFHGLQFADLSDAHLRTWESEDGSSLWPQKWLIEEFAMARILCVSYDGGVRKSAETSFDMHIIVENLFSDFMQGKVGQTPNCPVVLIGHCFGGLVIEKLCLEASKLKQVGLESQRPQIGTFLDNVKGVFFYGVPHHGTLGLSKATKLLKSPLLTYFETLGKDASRLGFEFNQLCRVYAAWQVWGLGENLPGDRGIFDGIVAAPESSARYGDNFNLLAVDHMSICKPQDKADKRFYFLTQLLHIIARNSEVEVPVHESHGLPTYPIDLEKRALEVRKKLIGGTTLGLFGMGGIGKTTLAKQIFNTISKDFEYTCFLDNVKGIPRHDLEERVLNHFHHNGIKSDKGSTQWFHLKNKTTLIAMDDIDSEDQLKVLPHLKHFSIGSRVIMTSRDREVFKFYEGCIIHEVECLKEDVAKKLFCHHAFGLKYIPDVLIDNVNALVKKCDGLPLTLEVIGTYLRDHGTDLNVWKETLNRLGRAQATTGARNDRVWASLRVSYDSLLEEEQEMFLEAALIFFEKPLDHALAGCSTLSENTQAAWTNTHTTWKNLLSRSLVREVSRTFSGNFNEYREIWVHEQLRDLAENIANGIVESGSDETTNSIVDGLNDNKVNPRTKCLRLSYSKGFPKNHTTLELDSLANLESLKYMDLVGVSSKGSGKGVTRKLSILNFGGVQRDQLSKFEFNLNNMENLAILELSYFQIPKEFTEALGNLTNLQILHLSHLEGLDCLPKNFGSLRRLRQLELAGLSSMILPKSFGNLVALEDLTLHGIKSLQLPESLGNVSSLVKLTISGCEGLAGLPSKSFGRRLTSLKELHISSCRSIKCLPESLRDVSSLVKLIIDDCEELAGLPESFGPRLTSLKELHISSCRSIKCLPESLGHASALVKLTIGSCEKFVGLADTFGSPSLEIIRIWGCPSIKGLSQCFSRLPRLKELSIQDCFCFEELGDEFGNLSSLRELRLSDVPLKSFPKDFGELTTLTKLDVSIGELETLSESFRFPKFLQEIKLKCPKFESLPESLGELALLERLNTFVERVESLPLSVGNLHSLRHLTFSSAVAKGLPDSLWWLSSLKTLKLDCPHLARLPDSLRKLSSLEKLSIYSSSLESLPDSIGQLSSLQRLTILGSEMLESLPDSLGQLSSLKKVKLSFCKRLKSLPESLGRRQQAALPRGDQSDQLTRQAEESSEPMKMEAMTLSVYFCPLLDEFNLASLGWMVVSNSCGKSDYRRNPNPDSLGQLSFLKEVTLCSCTRLKTLSESLGMLSSLEKLTIQCDMLESLPDSLGQLSSLESLTIEWCDMLESLPDSLGQLPYLKKVTLRFCKTLKTLPESLGRWSLGQREVMPQGDQRDQLMWQAEESPEPMKTEAMTLSIQDCPLLENSVLESLGWMLESRDFFWRCYRRNQVAEKSVERPK